MNIYRERAELLERVLETPREDREAFLEALREARRGGVTLQVLADALEVSKQRVWALLDD